MEEAKKRILLCITLAERGGAQSFVVSFAQYLVQRGYEVRVAAGDGEWLKRECARRSIGFDHIPHLERELHPVRDFLALIELRNVIRSFKPDVIHLNSAKAGVIGSVATALRFPLTARRSPRVVYRIGGWSFLEPMPDWKRKLIVGLERSTARLKDVIVCVHPEDRETARERGIAPRKAVVAIPNGIDIQAFERNLLSRKEAREALHLSPDAPVFGTIANFFPAKQLDRYMDACAATAETIPNAKFVLIGDGREYLKIEERRKALGLDQSVLMIGARNDAANLLKAFDVFVLPSAKEGMSWALLEAMAAGLPCVATDVGAARWMLENGEGGWLAPHDDTAKLAEAMIEACRTRSEQQKGKRAKHIVRTRFPLSRTLAENERVLFTDPMDLP